MVLETGQGSGTSAERMGGYDPLILSLLFVSLIFLSCCYHEPVLLVSAVIMFCHFVFFCINFVVILLHRLCYHVLLHVLIYASCSYMMFMLHGHTLYDVMNVCDVILLIINYYLHIIIIELIYGIKLKWKMPNILTIQKPNYRHFSVKGLLLC